ncbi:P-loop containing nucleoside triphosphate hydrolase protein [Baffinella frigidus]|nr:P-loop containing nucleoside triphosphate hydrolase protein [Cryptophyta sp. CCMP2293]
MPFQKEGVKFGLARGGRVLIGDEMGLGKTLQAIAVAATYIEEWPLLVVCPSSMRGMWEQEILKWLPTLVAEGEVNVIYTGKDEIDADSKVTIISYDLFAKMKDSIDGVGFRVVVADEAHYLKNAQAKRSSAITPVIKSADRAILLTGTPALARPVELFNLLNSLHPEMFDKFITFVYRYCDAHQGHFGLETGGSSNLEELHLVLQTHAMVRRLKKDVLTQLPAKRRQRVFLQVQRLKKDVMTQLPAKRRQRVFLQVSKEDAIHLNAQMGKLTALGESLGEGADENDAYAVKMQKQTLIMKLYTETGKAKMNAVADYVKDMLDCGAKFLVFAHHIEVLDAIEAAVKTKKVGYIRIDGSTPPRERQSRVADFQTKDTVRVAVLSVTAAGTGLTLTAAHTVVFAELHWTPGIMLQAEDRVHRIGQESAVNVHYLLAKGTCDDLIWESVSSKMRIVGRALDGKTGDLNAARIPLQASLDEAQRIADLAPSPSDTPASGSDADDQFVGPPSRSKKSPGA